MVEECKIRRALFSVYDKTGVVDFARALHDEFGVEIISTGGTAKVLQEAGIPVTLVEDVTGFPEMMNGRVKTLHPKIHAAILADRDNPEHMRQLAEQGIEPIDMVVVNLYPFEETIAKPDCTFAEAIEMIDIGGPCLLRAAAKNHKHVLVVSQRDLYASVLAALREWANERDRLDALESGAFGAFWDTTGYDAQIAQWLSNKYPDGSPWYCVQRYFSWGALRYGENPHQVAKLLSPCGLAGESFDLTAAESPIDDQEDVQERISFNNYADASAALELCAELTRAFGAAPRGLKPAARYEERCAPDKEPRASARAVLRDGRSPRAQSPESQPPQSQSPQAETPGDRTSVERILREQPPDLASAFQEPDPKSPAWLLTWTTYGSWLPGDQRGFVSRRPADAGGRVIRNLSGTLYDADQKDVEEAARERMQGAPVTLEPAHAHTALRAFVEAAANHGINIVALSIMPDHVHLLCQGEQSGSELMQLFKGVSARRLGEAHQLVEAPRWWAKSGSRRHIRKGEDLQGAIEYVCGQERALRVGWFAETSRGNPGGIPRSARAEARGSLLARGSRCVCFIKHTNACGAAVEADPIEAYQKAYLGDPNAAMGGILAVNFGVDAAFAKTVMESLPRWGKDAGAGAFFVEVWLAPSFDEDAVEVIRTRKKWGQRVRLLALGDMNVESDPSEMDIKRIAGGVLMQTRDLVGLNEDQWRVVTERQPTEAELDDLRLAWLICKHTRSNAITVCKDGMLVGNGAGQMSRVMSCRIATWLAKDNGHDTSGAVAASDAFFPFRDGPDILADAGVTALIQPGGSKKDQQVIDACNERGLAMIFTGTRHFRH